MASAGAVASMMLLERDPHWANVQLLVGADTAIVDESPAARSLTAAAGAVRTTTSPVIGTGSLLFSNDGDAVWAADDNNLSFANVDFTVECAFSATADQASFRFLFSKWDNEINQREWGISYNPSGSLFQFFFSYNGTTPQNFAASAVTPASFFNGTRRHIAVTRNGATLRMFVDGVLQANTFNIATNSLFNGTARCVIGARSVNGTGFTGSTFVGRIDEARVTRGVARYTATYTPRSTRFPRG